MEPTTVDDHPLVLVRREPLTRAREYLENRLTAGSSSRPYPAQGVPEIRKILEGSRPLGRVPTPSGWGLNLVERKGLLRLTEYLVGHADFLRQRSSTQHQLATMLSALAIDLVPLQDYDLQITVTPKEQR